MDRLTLLALLAFLALAATGLLVFALPAEWSLIDWLVESHVVIGFAVAALAPLALAAHVLRTRSPMLVPALALVVGAGLSLPAVSGISSGAGLPGCDPYGEREELVAQINQLEGQCVDLARITDQVETARAAADNRAAGLRARATALRERTECAPCAAAIDASLDGLTLPEAQPVPSAPSWPEPATRTDKAADLQARKAAWTAHRDALRAIAQTGGGWESAMESLAAGMGVLTQPVCAELACGPTRKPPSPAVDGAQGE